MRPVVQVLKVLLLVQVLADLVEHLSVVVVCLPSSHLEAVVVARLQCHSTPV